jgi:MraZ protein
MLRLRGNSPATVDDKGRLKLPMSFKSQFDVYANGLGADVPRFYLTSLDGRAARLYPLPVWEEIEGRLDKVPSTNPAKRRFLEITAYFGSEVELDSQGRFVIPGILREAAQLVVDHLAIWNRVAFERKLAVEPLSGDDFAALSDLGI